MAQWYFNLYRPGDKKRNPIQGEFFSSEAIAEPGRVLVREGIQNSLDAAVGEEPVLIRIFISGDQKAATYSDANEFFPGAWDHFRVDGNGLRQAPETGDKCKYLVFEDFNTKGLIGDPAESDSYPGRKNSFFHFFRGEGISDKSEGDRGRWGVGKIVFQRSSLINTMFGLTVRHDDHRQLLMGVSVLKSHRIGQSSYTPDGWFGIKEENDLVMPISDQRVLARFRSVFSLNRGTEPGLSIVVPWLDEEVTPAAIVEAVLRDYFYPVLTGRLEVIVEAPDMNVTVSKASLDTELSHIGGDLEKDLRPTIELARWALTQNKETIPKLCQPNPRKAMQWSAELVPEELVCTLSQLLTGNERVAVRVPVNVREKGKPTRESYFDVFMIRDGSDRSDRPTFVREELIIPDVRAPRSRGMTALVIAEDRPLAAFLGDSENPSHTQWQHDGSNFKGKYSSGRKDLEFVIRSVREIVKLLTESESEEDLNLLADIFNLPGESLKEKKPQDNKPGTESDRPRPSATTQRTFNIARQSGGFIVTAAKNVDHSQIPSFIEIETAYEVRRGNAFGKYKLEDFNLEDDGFRIETSDAVLLTRAENRLTARLDGQGFRIAVTGFDERRDLRVKIKKVEDAHASTIA